MADPKFDIEAARKSGYTDGEIADYLGKQRGFDVAGARKSGYSDADVLAHLTKPKTASIGDVAGSTAMGLVDAGANVLGAPVDVVNWARKAGGRVADSITGNGNSIKSTLNQQITGQAPKEPAPFGGSESIKGAIDYAMTLPGRVGDAVSQGSFGPLTDSRTARFTPETRAEKVGYGTGEGVGNALSVLLPATAISRATQGVNALGPRVANVLAQQPIAQTAMGAFGGAVTGATDSPALGLAASLAVPGVNMLARRAITPIQPNLTTQEANIVRSANNEGIRLTAGKQTNNTTLRALEDTFANSPGASGPMKNALRGEREDFNQAVMSRTGQTVRDASPDTIERTYRVLGQTFDDLVSRTTLNPDVQFARDIQATAQNYGRRLGTDQAPVFASYMQDIEPLIQAIRTPGAAPQITGEVFQNIRSNLARRIRKAGAQPELQDALSGIATALDDVMERSATSPALRQEWQDARRQYQALKTIDKAMGGGTQADRSAADIPYGGLKGAVKQADTEGYARGRGQLNELSRIGDYLAARTPNSGTPAQQSMMDPWRWPGIVIGNRASRIYNSPAVQNYLAHGLGGVQVNPVNLRALLSSLAAQEAIDGGAPGPSNALRPGGGQ